MNEGTSTTAPMTRAQKFQWYLEKGLAEGVRSLPPSTTGAVRSLVRALERRFDILRTSIGVVDGELRQRLHESGCPMLVVDVPGESEVPRCMATLADEFRSHRQGRLDQLLVQFYLLRSDDRQWLAVIADNVAVDAAFHRVMEEETTRILAGQVNTRPSASGGFEGLQPSEAAALESSGQGELERAEAAAYLRRHFSIAPPRLHPSRRSNGTNGGQYYRCTLGLRDADRIFSRIITSTGLLPSVLILTAFAQLMCWRCGTDSCSVNVSVDNRHNTQLRRVLGATAQRAPVALRRQDRTLLTAAAEVQQSLSSGHPVYGRYDPFDLIRERVEAQHRRGVCLTTDLAFNFIPPPQGWTALIESDCGELGDGAGPDSEIGWAPTNEVSYEYGASLSVRWTDPRSARLSIHGDSEVIKPSQCQALLRGVELMLKRAAVERDCVVGEIAGDVGLHQLHRTTCERQIGGRWIDLKAIEDRLLGMEEVDAAELVFDPGNGCRAPRLTARVAAVSGSTITTFDLRQELLEAVETGEVLVTPDWYEIAGGPAARAGGRGGDSSGDGREAGGRLDATEEEEEEAAAAIRGALEGSLPVPEVDLDRCYVRAGGSLARYPEFAARLRQRGYVPPDFASVSGMRTLRNLARQQRRQSRLPDRAS